MKHKHLFRGLATPERTTKTTYNYSHAARTSIWRALWISTVLTTVQQLRMYKLGIIGTRASLGMFLHMSTIQEKFSMTVLILQHGKWCSRVIPQNIALNGQLSIQLHFYILSRAVEKGLDVEEISQSGISPYRSNLKQHMASSKLFPVHLWLANRCRQLSVSISQPTQLFAWFTQYN